MSPKSVQFGFTFFKMYFLCPTADCVQLRLKDVNSTYVFQFKFERYKSGSRYLINLTNIYFCEFSKLYLNILIGVPIKNHKHLKSNFQIIDTYLEIL
jgi:hypothetical protein